MEPLVIILPLRYLFQQFYERMPGEVFCVTKTRRLLRKKLAKLIFRKLRPKVRFYA